MSHISGAHSPADLTEHGRHGHLESVAGLVNRRAGSVAQIEHLMLATDLSDRSDNAFLRALEIARERNAQLNVLHVVEPGLPKRVTARRAKEAHTLIRQQIGLLDPDGICDITVNTRVGEPFIEIVRETIELGSEVIILGSDGRRLSGSDADPAAVCLLGYCDRPILVVRNSPNGSYRRVVMDVDLSAAGARALALVQSIALGAEMHFVHSYEPLIEVANVSAVPTESRAERLNRVHLFVGSSRGELDTNLHRGGNSTISLANGTLVDALSDAAKRHGADLVAVGTTDLSTTGNANLADGVRRLVSASPCDVLIIPPSPRN